MAKKKVTRKQLLKEPDEFLTFSGRAALFIREHSRLFTYLGGAVAAGLLIYLGMTTFMGYINKKGQTAYNTAYYILAENANPEKDAQALKESAELFQKVIDKYGMSKVSRLAFPELAYLRMAEKKYDEAIGLYLEFLGKVPDNSPYQSLARLALAACYEANGELESAVESLSQVVDGPNDVFKEQAMLSLARVYRLDNQKDKSKKILEEFLEKFKSSPFLPIAKAHLAEHHS
ncbi:MAG: tetratricopeptide repeat protein [Desulfobacteraceae bacterium]|jgi:predicted negative regulator of RcsB-dependent stress response